jgi:hypothetical protein
MEDEEPPSKEPPLFSFSCLFILCIFVPVFCFYPIKACFGLFCLYATHVGYTESKQRQAKIKIKHRLKHAKDALSLEKPR